MQLFTFLALLASAGLAGGLSGTYMDHVRTITYTEPYTATRSRAETYDCGGWHWSYCTRYHTDYYTAYREARRYECYSGYSESSDRCHPVCFGQILGSACHQQGRCDRPDYCVCNRGFYSPGCDSCPSIAYCSQVQCTQPSDVTCYQCNNQGSSIATSLFWPIDGARHCGATCSYNSHWCWPGTCSDGLASSCQCADGFSKHSSGVSYTKCELTKTPTIHACKMRAATADGEKFETISGTVTECRYERDRYVNSQMTNVSLSLQAELELSVNLGTHPSYISTSVFGITGGTVEIRRHDLRGQTAKVHSVALTSSECEQKTFDRSTPHSGHLACDFHGLDTSHIHLDDGDRLCVNIEPRASGYLQYKDFSNSVSGKQLYAETSSSRELCLRYDATAPTHCSADASCTTLPVQPDRYIVQSPDVTVTIQGWTDPVPQGGVSDAASGIEKTSVLVYEVSIGSANSLKVSIEHVMEANVTGGHVTLTLPKEPRLYAIVAEVKDVADNVRHARTFVLYDNSSKLELRDSTPMVVTSASNESNYQWQKNHGQVCASWKKRFYNTFYATTNLLQPVEADPSGLVSGPYEHRAALLPVTGTPNAEGVVHFSYSVQVNNATVIGETDSHLAQEACVTLASLKDGDAVRFDVTADDVMGHRRRDQVTVHVDRSPPNVQAVGLAGGQGSRLYVHNTSDLARLDFAFRALDPHSGLRSVQWMLGTLDNVTAIGSGVWNKQQLPEGASCPPSTPCYCPAVGPCEFYNYSLPLEKLAKAASHHRDLLFTVVAENNARLRSAEHVDILVDTSAPTTGVVREGSPGTPDLDFSGSPALRVHWSGFLDPESDISHYRVIVAPDCLDASQMALATDPKGRNTSRVMLMQEVKGQEAKFSLPAPGKYVTTVEAVNYAMMSSAPVCSDGVIYDVTPPVIRDVTIKHAQTAERVVRLGPGDVFLLQRNVTLRRLDATACVSAAPNVTFDVDMADVAWLRALALSNVTLLSPEQSAGLCLGLASRAGSPLRLFLPRDEVHLAWRMEETQSEVDAVYVGYGSQRGDSPDIQDFHPSPSIHRYSHNHEGLPVGAPLYVFVKAVNKAGLPSSLVLGPVVIDETPPRLQRSLSVAQEAGWAVLALHQHDFQDQEETLGHLDLHLALECESGVLTDWLPVQDWERPCPGSEVKADADTFCMGFPLARMRELAGEAPQHFRFRLQVRNLAGYVTLVKSEEFQVPSMLPPGDGWVIDLDPTDLDGGSDVDFHQSGTRFCVRWGGFRQHSNMRFYLGLGTAPSRDDVISFQAVQRSQQAHCLSAPSLRAGQRYLAVVRASCPHGDSLASSDGFVLLGPASFPTLKVKDGLGCADAKAVTLVATAENSSETASLQGRDASGVSGTGGRSSLMIRPRRALHYGETYTLYVRKDRGWTVESEQVFWLEASSNATHETRPFHVLSPNVVFRVSTSTQSSNIAPTTSPGQQNSTPTSSSSSNSSSSSAAAAAPAVSSSPFTDAAIADLTLLQCMDDVDFDFREELSAHWEMEGSPSLPPTHFAVSLLRQDACPRGTACTDTTQDEQLVYSSLEHQFKVVTLQPGALYRVAVKPCYGHVCGTPSFSNGVRFLPERPSPEEVDLTLTEVKGACPTFTLHWEPFDCSEGSAPFHHVTLTRLCRLSGRETELLSRAVPTGNLTWLSIPSPNVCVTSAENPKAEVLGCVTAVCRSGQQVTSCRSIDVIDHTLAPTEATASLADVSVDMHNPSQVLHSMAGLQGQKRAAALRDADVDYVRPDVHIGAVLDREWDGDVDWFLMAEGQAPPGDCGDDPSCLYHVTTSTRSVTVPDVTLKSGTRYAFCARPAKDTGGEARQNASTLCSDGFLVDGQAPAATRVQVLGGVPGFLSNAKAVLLQWDDVLDLDPQGRQDRASGVASVAYALGTYKGGADVFPFTDAGRRSREVIQNLTLQQGVTYYASVRATDRVGLTSVSSSRALLLDTTPPQLGVVTTDSPHGYVTSRRLEVSWSGFQDAQSGIRHFRVSVSSAGAHSDVFPSTLFTTEHAVLTLNDLVDGHNYTLRLTAVNGVGLSDTLTYVMMADTSPPITGHVTDTHPNVTDGGSRVRVDTGALAAHWSGFSDPHSGLALYRVGVGTQPHLSDLAPMQHVGLQTEMTWQRPLTSGVTYYVTVEACNKAGLCSRASSPGLKVDSSPPVPGLVTLGYSSQHRPYLRHRRSLCGQWVGFSDPHSGLASFHWCVGTTPTSCDVTPFQEHALLTFLHASNLSLPLNSDLYLRVKATNKAGLSSMAVSDRFRVDVTPPEFHSLPEFQHPYLPGATPVTSQWESELLLLGWGAWDPDSPVVRHRLALQTSGRLHQTVRESHLGRHNSHLFRLDRTSRLVPGDNVTAYVTACNAAGLCSTSASRSLLVDSSPPTLGSFSRLLNWTNSHDSNSSTVVLTWAGFEDLESGITRHFLRVGRSYSGAELSGGTVGVVPVPAFLQSHALPLSQRLRNGDLLILSAWAQNSVGLVSPVAKVTVEAVATDVTQDRGTLVLQRHSCVTHYCNGDCTCSPTGSKCSPTGTCKEVAASDPVHVTLRGVRGQNTTSSSGSCLWMTWEGGRDVMRFEWSAGLKGDNPGSGVYPSGQPVWTDVDLQTSAVFCLQDNTTLSQGGQYVGFVRAWYSHDTYHTFTSTPLTLDSTPPVVRKAHFLNVTITPLTSSPDHLYEHAIIDVNWTGVFQDSQSDITDFEIMVGTLPGADDVIPAGSVGVVTSYSLDGVLHEGTRHHVTVVARNSAGLSVYATSRPLLVDDEPPLAGVVFPTRHHRIVPAQWKRETLGASWHGFTDRHSYVADYQVAVIDSDFPPDHDLVFTSVGLQSSLELQNLTLEHGHAYRVKVRATDAAGHVSAEADSPAILIDVTPPQAVTCRRFTLMQTYVIGSGQQSSGNDVTMQVDTRAASTGRLGWGGVARLGLEAGSLYEVSHSGHAHLQDAGDLGPTLHLSPADSPAHVTSSFQLFSPAQSELKIVAPSSRQSNTVVVNVSRCDPADFMTSDQPQDALRMYMTSPDDAHISVLVHDPESGLGKLLLGLGTTAGGYQIQALTPMLGRLWQLPRGLDHGTPVYVTLYTENQAGLSAVFDAGPALVDRTPPDVMLTDVQVTAIGTGPVLASINVTAEWSARDLESDVIACDFFVGPDSGSAVLREWRPLAVEGVKAVKGWRSGRLQVEVPVGQSAGGVGVSMRCWNGQGLQSSAPSRRGQVPRPPDSRGASLAFLVENVFSVQHEPHVQPVSDRVTLRWEGFQGDDIRGFKCRLSRDGHVVQDWADVGIRHQLSLDPGMTQNQTWSNLTAEVTCYSKAGLTSDPVAASLLVDTSLPQLTGSQATAVLQGDALTLSWADVFAKSQGPGHMAAPYYTLALGRHTSAADLLPPTSVKGDHYVFHLPRDFRDRGVYVTLRAELDSGLSSVYAHYVTF